MTVKAIVRDLLRSVVRRYGYELVDGASLYEWQRPSAKVRPFHSPADPYLKETNPRLIELIARYAAFDPTVTAPALWTTDHISGRTLRYFRGDDAYVWQRSGPNMNEFGYVLATYYVRAIDSLGLLNRLTDDDAFGNYTCTIGGSIVSRDLLDSIIELCFLERHLRLSSLKAPVIVDIGAGYGRLAHRACDSLHNIGDYICVDAVAQSTFISEFYLQFRRSRARVVALDLVEAELMRRPADIAINVHSFSECRIDAIDWWLALLERTGVRYLMVVPNDPYEDGRGTLITNDRSDFSHVILRHGYKLVADEPKFCDPMVHRYALNPTRYYLFELT